MDKNPLTDSTSLIAYRLARGETSRDIDQLARDTASGTRLVVAAIVALKLLLVGIWC